MHLLRAASGALPTPSHSGHRSRPLRHGTARSREAGVVTEMLVTKAEQLSDDGAFASGLRLSGDGF